ncbi:hypothetical protein RN001_014172 [Aquatica leii]|uniref:Uncharacterized protein n=1 Tax=Aquatica leii TaxID=1421715 RepID=A0AAN7P1Q6_9COLE|nr:hypothetical protein RN001_014172 [Aquatica leii]
MNQIILLSLFVKFSHALVCYECDSLIHGASCMNQLNVDEIQPYQCGKTSRSNFTTDYECVREEKFYEINNRRTYVRKCQPRSTNFDYCQSLQQLGIAQGFKLEKCEPQEARGADAFDTTEKAQAPPKRDTSFPEPHASSPTSNAVTRLADQNAVSHAHTRLETTTAEPPCIDVPGSARRTKHAKTSNVMYIL